MFVLPKEETSQMLASFIIHKSSMPVLSLADRQDMELESKLLVVSSQRTGGEQHMPATMVIIAFLPPPPPSLLLNIWQMET